LTCEYAVNIERISQAKENGYVILKELRAKRPSLGTLFLSYNAEAV
jgi:hypothetical protein